MNAYISSDLNMVRELDPARSEIALKMQAFLEKGGTIQVLPFWVSDGEPSKPSTMTPNFQSRSVKDETDQQAARIRKMALTMNQREICEAEGILRGVLRGIGKRYNIKFPIGCHNIIPRNKATPEAEAALVVSIKECIAEGVNRNQCAKLLDISTTLLLRLIDDYTIDYPKLTPGFKKKPAKQ